MPSSCYRRTYNFGEFELDAEECRLLCSGSAIPLRPRPFETLLYLVEHHGHLVGKAELLDNVWEGVLVSEGALTRCIKEIRRALGDDAHEPRYIETRARFGYTFVAEVETTEETKRPSSIAVLPFVDLSREHVVDCFSDGLTEELTAALTALPTLHVVASTSSFAVKGQRADVREIGRRLNVDTVLEGSVRCSGQRLRITVQLVDARSGYHRWSETFDREMRDALALQEEIGRSVVRRLAKNCIGR